MVFEGTVHLYVKFQILPRHTICLIKCLCIVDLLVVFLMFTNRITKKNILYLTFITVTRFTHNPATCSSQ